MRLSSGLIKLIHSLKVKKYRDKTGLFIAEGEKLIFDLLNTGIQLRYLLLLNNICDDRYEQIKDKIVRVTEAELKKISEFKTGIKALGVFKIPKYTLNTNSAEKELILYCDDIQDPGNFGTIIRTCDWFGIRQVVCSPNSVDLYNPKVIRSGMGSVGRVSVNYISSNDFFLSLPKNIPIYGTFLDGVDIYQTELESYGIIVIGNEGSGITKTTEKYVNYKLHIPNFSRNKNKPESLNASIATGIICSEFCRQKNRNPI
jgi:TrmH family RNA methyltransferase